MFDTVSFAENVGYLDGHKLIEQGFTHQRTTLPTGEVRDKFYCNPDSEETLPRLTYYGNSGYLVSEVSLPKLINGQNVDLLYQDALPQVYERIQDHVGEKTGVVTDLAAVPLCRVDYCYSWPVGDHLPHYIEALSRLRLSRHNRRPVNAESVDFFAKANRLKFYDKFAESKMDFARGLLRCELSVFDTNYMAENWLNCERTAGELLQDQRAIKMLNMFLERLGLDGRPIPTKTGYLDTLIERFGTRKAERLLLFALLYEQHGTGLIDWRYTRPTYYRRRKALKGAGLLTFSDGEVALPGLIIEE